MVYRILLKQAIVVCALIFLFFLPATIYRLQQALRRIVKIKGSWELITLSETFIFNESTPVTLSDKGSITGFVGGSWSLNENLLTINLNGSEPFSAEVIHGWDWGNGNRTL